MSDKPLHIVGLQAENFKRLKAVTITPKGRMVQITGRNAHGKSSVLEAIWAAMGGAAHIPGQPIHQGHEKAKVRLDLGELVVTRSFTPKGTTLTVEDPEGRTFKSPQGLLDGLMGAITFDPLAFARMDPKKQAVELRRIAKVDLDIPLVDSQIKDAYDRRTHLNREARTAQAAADGITLPELPPEPTEAPADLTEIMDRMQAHSKAVQARVQAQADRRKLEEDIEGQKARRARAQAAIDEIDKWLAQVVPTLATPLPGEVGDGDAIRAELDAAQARNADIQAKRTAYTQAVQAQATRKAQKDLQVEQARRFQAQADELTKEIEAKEAAKAKALQDAAMPIPELGFQDGEVTYRGLPFAQASAAEQLRVSTAIAMAANPRLRVIRIEDGSLLDEDNLQVLAEMAASNDFQIWIEQVDSTGRVGIYLEDGEVRADNQGEEVEAPSMETDRPEASVEQVGGMTVDTETGEVLDDPATVPWDPEHSGIDHAEPQTSPERHAAVQAAGRLAFGDDF